MRVTVVSTKGGVGKTTVAANLGGLLADFGFRVLLIDADVQPTLSSYYPLRSQAEGGLFELVALRRTDQVVSATAIPDLDLVVSNDAAGQLPNVLLHAPDGRLRLKYLLGTFDTEYDFILLDTQGSLSALQDCAVLAADLLLAPLAPELLSAREFSRGTLAMLDRLEPMGRAGSPVPPLVAVINRLDRTRDARAIASTLREEIFAKQESRIRLLQTAIPNLVAYREAARLGIPAHRHEPKRPARRTAPAARDTMIALARELLPDWRLDDRLESRTTTTAERSGTG